MKLRHIISSLPGAIIEGECNRLVQSIVSDPLQVTPGALFLLSPQDEAAETEAIQIAVERGAVAIMGQGTFSAPHRLTRIRVSNWKIAVAQASSAFFGNPSARLKMIGVIGTRACAPVASMVKQLLEARGLRTGLMGSIRYEIGPRSVPATRSVTEAVQVQQTLAQMLKAGLQACVVEISPESLGRGSFRGTEFDALLITKWEQSHPVLLTPDLDSTQLYRLDRTPCFDQSPAWQDLVNPLTDEGKRACTVINIDDEGAAQSSAELEIKLTYGLENPAQIRASALELQTNGTDFDLHLPGSTTPCHLSLPGRENVYHLLAGVGALYSLGLTDEHLAGQVRALKSVAGFLERVEMEAPFNVFIDSARDEDSLRQALTGLREITRGRLLLAFGCEGESAFAKRPTMGKIAAAYADHTIITSDNPRRESPQKIACEILRGYYSERSGGVGVELDRSHAIHQLITMAREGDTILLAGKGDQAHQELEETVVPFDDREIARQAVEMQPFLPFVTR